MASAGTVTVDFAAETAKFTAELKKINKTLTSIEGGFKTVERVARTAFAAFSAGAFVGFIRNAAEAADQLGKTASQLRLSTTELKAFQIAAADAGVEVGSSNRLLAEASKRLSEAARGSGEAAKFIKALGLDVGELRGLKPDQLFEQYARAISNLKDPGDQAAAAQALMGKSALDAMPFILDSGDAINQAREFVERYGLALSEVDTKQVEAANDAIGRLATVSEAAGQQIAAGLAPFVEQLATSLLESTASTERMREAAGKFGAIAQTAFALAANAANLAKAAFFGVAGVVASMIADLAEGIAALSKFIQDATTRVLDFQLFVARVVPGAVGDAIEQRIADAQEPLRRLQANISDATANVAAAFRASSDANFLKAEESLRKIQSIEQIQEGIIATLESSRVAAEQAVKEQQQAQAGGTASLLEDDPVLTAQQQADALNEVNKAYAEASKQLHRDVTTTLSEELQKRHDLVEFYAEQERSREEAAQQAIIDARYNALSAGIDALQTYAGSSKTAAKALVAINKARAIAEAIQNTYQGATMQLTTGDPYTATFRAAAVVAYGLLQVAAIAKTAYGEAQQINANGGAPVGSPSNPVHTTTRPSTTSDGDRSQDTGQSVLAVHIHGNFFGNRETVNYLMDAFREEINTRDVVLFSPESRQAQELVPQ